MAERGEVVVELESVSSDIPAVASTAGVSLSWRNIKYCVPETTGNIIKRSTGTQRVLLNGVSGCVRAGETLAIMAPSGGGKSTLLDILSHRVRSGKGLQGEVMMNGVKKSGSYMKSKIAYVMQDDALQGVLTVRENLYYSAMLRLPSSMSRKEKEARVEEVIAELGLSKCADTKIGTPLIRGVSGGERRRCSIGMELVTRPAVLLLDECTSGLDSTSARNIIESLSALAKTGRTVIFTIHQPSSSIFHLFDKILLLSKGNQVFFGPTNVCVDFFAQMGHPLPPMMNPADFFLEAINFDFSESQALPADIQKIVDGYQESQYMKQLHACIELQHHVAEEHEEGDGAARIDRDDGNDAKYQTSRLVQTYYLMRRTLANYIRDPAIFLARIGMYSLLALVMGLLYLRMDGNDAGTIQDRISVLFFSVAFLSFMSVASIPAFLLEREIFVRERRNSYYSVLPYALSHALVSLPFLFFIALAFTGISYYMMALNPEPEAFFYFMLVLFVSLANAEALVVTISTLLPNFIIAIGAGAGLFGLYMLLCGFFVLKSNIPPYFIWIHYLTFHKYAFEGFMENEFSGSEFYCGSPPPNSTIPCSCSFPDLNNDCIIQGDEILSYYEYESVNKWYWLLVLVGMALFYNFVYYISLRFLNTGKR
eukprot:CAMPEP_0119121132 /NCGR_PEP_ID=MMETSP1310-20130426/1893_1 /TAXON_ID=464262 /ORGANISM="Genus nov. species nov., Strain RCC2339" /LENGTH=651 /DNA_ID=CAMNT_0007110671 /DNA_START=84 /DNA_END=2039 /DNA_ORIENTATION=+